MNDPPLGHYREEGDSWNPQGTVSQVPVLGALTVPPQWGWATRYANPRKPLVAFQYVSQPPLAVVEPGPGSRHPFSNQLHPMFAVTSPELDTNLLPV